MLVLDEPAEHLDTAAADALTADLLAATAGRTTLLITHRLAACTPSTKSCCSTPAGSWSAARTPSWSRPAGPTHGSGPGEQADFIRPDDDVRGAPVSPGGTNSQRGGPIIDGRSVMDPTDLARIQFATTSIYHFLFVPVTIGLAFLVAILHTMWYRSGNPSTSG